MIPDLATSLLQAANHSDWTVEAERIVIGTLNTWNAVFDWGGGGLAGIIFTAFTKHKRSALS